MNKLIVIFDLDGTLIDTIGDLSAAVEYALERNGFPGHSVQEYRGMVGHGIRNLVTRALPSGTDDQTIETVLSDFVGYYTDHIDVQSRQYSGIYDLLKDLSSSGAVLAVASNKFQAGTEKLVKTAHNAGIPAIAVTWGFRPKSDLLAAEAIAESVSQLPELILSLTNRSL